MYTCIQLIINFVTVYICDNRSQSAADTVLSGYVSSYPPIDYIQSDLASCTAYVNNLPPNTAVKFTLLEFTYNVPSSSNIYKITIGDNVQAVKETDTVMRYSDSNGDVKVESVPEFVAERDDRIKFYSKYSGKWMCSFEHHLYGFGCS